MARLQQWHGSALADAAAAGRATAAAVLGGGRIYPWSGRAEFFSEASVWGYIRLPLRRLRSAAQPLYTCTGFPIIFSSHWFSNATIGFCPQASGTAGGLMGVYDLDPDDPGAGSGDIVIIAWVLADMGRETAVARAAKVGLGHIVALYYRSSTSYMYNIR
jgi:hypothetical protein